MFKAVLPEPDGARVFGWSRSQLFHLAPPPDLRYILYISRKKCQLHEQSQEKSFIFYIIDGKEIILDTQ